MSQSISGSCNTTTTTTTTTTPLEQQSSFSLFQRDGQQSPRLYNKINTPPSSIHPPPLPSSSSPLLFFYFKQRTKTTVSTSFPARCQKKNTRRSQFSYIFLSPSRLLLLFFGVRGGGGAHYLTSISTIYTHTER